MLFFYSLPGIPPFPLSVGRLNLHHLDALVADLRIMWCSAVRRTRAEHAPNRRGLVDYEVFGGAPNTRRTCAEQAGSVIGGDLERAIYAPNNAEF